MKAQSYLFDSSFLIELADEIESARHGPAHRTLDTMPDRARFFVSPVTVAEVLEGAESPRDASLRLADYHQTVIAWQAAQRCAMNQARAEQRMGENDAWQAALAVCGGHVLVARDRTFEKRSWLQYLDFTKGN